MIIASLNTKGGPGKSCLAQNIGVILQVKYGLKVLIADGDPQETTAGWMEERKASGKYENIRFTRLPSGEDIRDDLLEAEKIYDAVVVDCGGHDSPTMRWVMTAATHVLIPFRAKRRDLKVLPEMEDIIAQIKPSNPHCVFRAVINQAPVLPTQMQRILDAKEACQSFGIEPLKTIIYHRNVYDDADEAGSSVIEMNTDKKACKEIENLVKELIGEENLNGTGRTKKAKQVEQPA